jgi:lysophospholipase L1-like esterase
MADSQKPGSTSRQISRFRRILFALVASGLSLLLALTLLEVGLRVTCDSDRFYPYHRNSVRVFYPSEEITPGVTGMSRFTTNSFGTRGPDPAGERIRILTIGGSSTACTVLDDAETWPALLMRFLNQKAGDDRFAWVTNSGTDGHNTHHHIMHARYLVPRIPDLDYVLVYAGLNDVGMWLYAEKFDPHFLDNPDNWNSRLGEAFRECNYTSADAPWYKRLEIWKQASILKSKYLSRRAQSLPKNGAIVQDARFQWMEKERQRRREARKRHVPRAKMDSLPVALEAYGVALSRIIAFVREGGAEPVMIAQALQDHVLTAEEHRRLWMGAMDGGKTYVERDQLVQLVKAYNERMRMICAKTNVLFIDLPSHLVGHRDLFFDGCHFNQKGAKVTARILADILWNQVLSKRVSENG